MAQKPILEMNVGEAIGAGLFFGINRQDPPLWFDGENVVFRRGGPEKAKGPKALVVLPENEDITAIRQSFVGAERRAYLGTTSKLYRFSGFEIERIGEDYRGGDWSLIPWGSWLLASNSLDPVQVWKNGGFASTLAGTTFEWSKLLAKRGPYVLAMNNSRGPTNISWCHTDDVEQWEATDENAAGEIDVRDLDSEIRAWAPLGNAIATYSQNSLVIVSYQGPPFYFGAQPALSGMGAISLNSIISTGRKNYGITRQGVYVTDGLEVMPIDDPAVRKWLQDNVNWAASATINGYHDDAMSQVVFNVPTGVAEKPNMAVAFCYASRAWSKWSFGSRASSDRSVYDYPLTSEGATLQLAGAQVSTREAWVESKPLDCGLPQNWKFFESLMWGLETAGDAVWLELGFSENPRDQPEWLPRMQAQDIVHIMREGVYLTIRVSSDAGNAEWLLSSFKLWGQKAGMRML